MGDPCTTHHSPTWPSNTIAPSTILRDAKGISVAMAIGRGIRFCFAFIIAFTVSLSAASTVHAANIIGQPEPWEIGFQGAASPVMHEIVALHDLVLWIIVAIVVFVIGLMFYIVWRFRASVHPKPSKMTHNTPLEILWTVVPALILVIVAVPSFRLLHFASDIPQADMTLKVTGHQWYWNYQYPDHGDLTFDAQMIDEEDLEEGQPRLLTTDETLVLPVGKIVRAQIISAPDGVIHSWAVPSLGVKMDAVPGRLNETWFKIEKEGLYYGQCSELCGLLHGFMPISIRAVSEGEFEEWLRYYRGKEALEVLGQ